MKYYSELLNGIFDSEEELIAAEAIKNKEEEEKKNRARKLKEEREFRRKELEEARAKYQALLGRYWRDYHSDDIDFSNPITTLYNIINNC